MPELKQTDETRILDYVKRLGSINNSQCCIELGIRPSQAWHLLRKMTKKGSLKPLGDKRWRQYVLP